MRAFLLSMSVACATLVGLASSASAATITLDAVTRGIAGSDGWINGEPTANYFAGRSGMIPEARNFFFFDLTGITGPIVSASLVLQAGVFDSPDASETYTLFDITTPLDVFMSPATAGASFNDLGSGVSYGSRVFTGSDPQSSLVTITLNASALADLQAALGTIFGLGGAVTTLGSGGLVGVFGGTSGFSPSRLVLETAPPPAAVPEPATLSLLGAGLVALVSRARRRES